MLRRRAVGLGLQDNGQGSGQILGVGRWHTRDDLSQTDAIAVVVVQRRRAAQRRAERMLDAIVAIYSPLVIEHAPITIEEPHMKVAGHCSYL